MERLSALPHNCRKPSCFSTSAAHFSETKNDMTMLFAKLMVTTLSPKGNSLYVPRFLIISPTLLSTKSFEKHCVSLCNIHIHREIQKYG